MNNNEFTTGEKRVRINELPADPAQAELVKVVKRSYADNIDELERVQKESTDREQQRVCAQAMTLAEDACDKHVKAITAA